MAASSCFEASTPIGIFPGVGDSEADEAPKTEPHKHHGAHPMMELDMIWLDREYQIAKHGRDRGGYPCLEPHLGLSCPGRPRKFKTQQEYVLKDHRGQAHVAKDPAKPLVEDDGRWTANIIVVLYFARGRSTPVEQKRDIVGLQILSEASRTCRGRLRFDILGGASILSGVRRQGRCTGSVDVGDTS